MNPTAPGTTPTSATAVGTDGTGQQEVQSEYLTRAEAVEFEKRLCAIERCIQSISDKDREIEDKVVRNTLDTIANAFALVQANSQESNPAHEQPLKDMAIQKIVTPTQEPASPSHPFPLSANPLRLLVTGPMSPEEMLDFCNLNMPDVPESDHRQMLEDLEHQYRQHMPVLVPNWWKGSPEQFLEKLNENLALLNLTPNLPLYQRQSGTLEVLLNMQVDHFYGYPD